MLYLILGTNWVTALAGIEEVRLIHDSICKLHYFLTYFLADTSPWLLVAITWERVLAVNFPHKIQVWTSRKKTYTYIAVVLLFFDAINFHFLLAVKLFVDEGYVECGEFTEAWRHYSWNIFTYIDLAKYSVLPFIAIIVGNILIFGRLIYAKKMAQRQLNVNTSKLWTDFSDNLYAFRYQFNIHCSQFAGCHCHSSDIYRSILYI